MAGLSGSFGGSGNEARMIADSVLRVFLRVMKFLLG